MGDPTPFQISCPGGEPFYACDYGTRFLGCCTLIGVDVCADGCEPDDLQAASFDQQYYSNITQNDCNTTIRAGEWYTCENTSPPFLGCCASNACSYAGGCPSVQLVPAQLSTNETEKAPFLPILIHQSTSEKTRTGAIAGGVGGSVVFAILIGFIIWYRVRKLRKHNIQQSGEKDQNRDRNLMTPPTSSPLSPMPKYNSPQDVRVQSVLHELHQESAPVAEIATSDVPLPVPELPAPDPASTTQIHPRRPSPNISGLKAYTASDGQAPHAAGTGFGVRLNGSLATNF